MKDKSFFLKIFILLLVIIVAGCNPTNKWGWKRSEDPKDVMDFINGQGAYNSPVKEFRISATLKNNIPDFIVYYTREGEAASPGTWSWKLSTSIEDAKDFINGSGAYTGSVKNFRICCVWNKTYPEFYIFYQTGKQDQSWAWKLATSTGDAIDFLNGKNGYTTPVKIARIASVVKGSQTHYYIFYQHSDITGGINNWRWKKSYDPDDVMKYLNGSGSYSKPVKGFDICAVERGDTSEYLVFNNQGTKIWIQSPLPNERFVKTEPIAFHAGIFSENPAGELSYQWTSGIDGILGTDHYVFRNDLTTGNHTITVNASDFSATTTIRIYDDLLALYKAEPSKAEIDRILNNFQFEWINGTGTDENWSAYDNFNFDQTSPDPSKMVAIAKIDILRHQRFSSGNPFTPGISIYDHLRFYVHTIRLRLDCGVSTGGGDGVNLGRNFSVWDARSSGSSENPDACKSQFTNPSLCPYISPLYLLLHEGRHCEPGAPGHTSCNGKSNMDPYFENGSGHASAALYLMWVYRYGMYDPQSIKTEAGNIASMLLKERFCTPATHSNDTIQAMINELLQ